MAGKKKFLCIVLALIFTFFAGCGKKSAGAGEILEEILKDYPALPYGNIYLAGADEGGEKYLSSDMICALYGDEAESDAFEAVEDYALYLSSRAFPF